MHRLSLDEILDVSSVVPWVSRLGGTMKFVNLCHYIDDLNRVAELRPAHRQYMARLDSENKLWAAGPFEDGTGALFIYEAVDLEAAEEIRQADPYFIGKAFAMSELAAWSPALYNAAVTDASP
jgi:uncharacterized protein